jgi:glucokinase
VSVPDKFLLVDADGTHARFAVVEAGEPPATIEVVPARSLDELIEALGEELSKRGGPALRGAAFSAPGPIFGQTLQVTHASLRLDADVLSERLGVIDVRLVNDFTARAMAMPLLGPEALEQIGGAPPKGQAPAAALGPSTGLGVSILNPDGFVGWVATASEGGHAALAAGNGRECAIIEHLRLANPYVSADRVLSDDGLLETAAAIAHLDGHAPRTGDFAQLVAAARAGDPIAREAFALFSRMDVYMKDIPLYLVLEADCGLLGLSALYTGRGPF